MIFSRIVGSVSRSARSRLLQSNIYSGFGHERIILCVTESCLEAKPCLGFAKPNLAGDPMFFSGFAKPCLPSNGGIGARNQFVSRKLFPDNHSVLASPIIRRLFSTELPEKRNYDIKEEIPRAKEPKSESDGIWPKPFSHKYFSNYIILFAVFYVMIVLSWIHRKPRFK